MIAVFSGPTISHRDISQFMDCVCLPPVRHGDIIRLQRQPVEAIGIIDGYFEGAQSVWHKEILHALDSDIPVFGSASMGALRAAECHVFGMTGVGRIFEWYRDGVIEGDDEVAVVHGPEETGYLVTSLPMVDVRATLDNAFKFDIINNQQRALLLEIAKGTYYKGRTWQLVLDTANDVLNSESLYRNLRGWLIKNKVNQKRKDALEMLSLMRSKPWRKPAKRIKSFHFQHTSIWDAAVLDAQSEHSEVSLGKSDRRVLARLRQDPDMYNNYYNKALLSRICQRINPGTVDDNALKASYNRFRKKAKLDSRSQLTEYLETIALSESELTRLISVEAKVEMTKSAEGNLQTDLIDQLKLDGQYRWLYEQE